MNDILDFLLQHWQLSAIFIALVVAYIIFEIKQDPGAKQVSAEQAVALYNHEQGLILDIRPNDEYTTGHIVGATQLDLAHIDNKIKKLQKYSNKPIIVVCSNGKQSNQIAKRLRTEGFAQALSLSGGMQAWQAAGLPLTTAAGSEF